MKSRAFLCVVLLSGCTSINSDRAPELGGALADLGYRPGQNVAAIERLGIRAWQYVDSRHLVISSEYSNYLLRFFSDCMVEPNMREVSLAGSGQLFTRVDPVVLTGESGDRECAVAHMQRLYLSD